MLTWCPEHERGLIPAGYDQTRRVLVPATWHALTRWTLTRAWTLAHAGGCAGQIVLVRVACDRCGERGN